MFRPKVTEKQNDRDVRLTLSSNQNAGKDQVSRRQLSNMATDHQIWAEPQNDREIEGKREGGTCSLLCVASPSWIPWQLSWGVRTTPAPGTKHLHSRASGTW